ncbi:MAG: hypothetical protein RMJ56_03350 [Gemmataceae bacterium]|nr:hypothetical protein [Gemmata sp.]MDW8196625.1 hypothetical protein [Gemmataceae bacterium]
MHWMAVAIPVVTLVGFLPTLRDTEPTDERAIAATIEKLGGKVQLDGDKVVEINLEGRRISDDDLKVLKPLRHLRKLDLEETPITDAGLKHLGELTSLEYLDLEETRVTDAGMEHLTGLKNLKVINLDDTRVTRRGEQILKDAIPGLRIDR